MNKQCSRKLRHEKGMATLIIVLLLLFVATLVTLYTANTTVREQQVSANQYRADQALSAANAGLDYALAYYSKYSGPDAVHSIKGDLSGDGFIDELDEITISGDGQEVFAKVTFTDVDGNNYTDTAVPTPPQKYPAFNGPHTITSVGYSDDRSATRTISVEVGISSSIGGGGNPGFPLIAKGIATNGGNWTIINRFSNATVWAGDAVPLGGSASSFLREVINTAGVNQAPVWASPVLSHELMVNFDGAPVPDDVLNASYSASGLNSDVIDRDDNLKNLDPDDYFKNFMVADKTTLREIALKNGQRFNSSDITWENDLVGLRGVIWVDVDGNQTDSNGNPLWRETGNMPMLGTESYPVTLIINGSFYTGGSGTKGELPSGQTLPTMIGLLYVIGNWDGGGNFVIQGSALVEGEVYGNGSPTLVYDERIYDGSLGNPPGAFSGVKAGTWKDW